ncbi:MAG: undecaprenyl/decaprenyl-phosphate alpha-N-acetylglucosaminyl 1-phosphate transferase, partial [Bacteroidota bacterium]|nr:undecaprenyl/decaprenyl-phosphate alpha-N-acetylglucosaminyl 1-phosphate transferase [Bacteroidota bacterium]
LRVFSIRILHRRSPFSPDRNHIHHLLLDKGFSHMSITFILVAINTAAIVLVYLLRSLDVTLLILSDVAVFFVVIALVYYLRPAPRLFVARNVIKETGELKKASKLASLVNDSLLEQKN